MMAKKANTTKAILAFNLYEGEFVSDIEGAEPQAVEPADKLATTWAALKAL